MTDEQEELRYLPLTLKQWKKLYGAKAINNSWRSIGPKPPEHHTDVEYENDKSEAYSNGWNDATRFMATQRDMVEKERDELKAKLDEAWKFRPVRVLEMHHNDADFDMLEKKHDKLLADWHILASKYDELKAKLDEQECLCAEKHLKDRDTIQELKAKLFLAETLNHQFEEWMKKDVGEVGRLRAELAKLKKDREKK